MTELRWRYGAATDVGKVRDLNEDSHLASRRLLAVADGVGGAAAGEVASGVTIAEVTKLARRSPVEAEAELGEVVDAARDRIRAAVAENPESEGMATTLTALWLGDDAVDIVHIGDSRAYQVRGEDFVQVTVDDSYVQHLVDEGAITPAEAQDHPYKSVVTRVLQANPAPAHFETRPAALGDRYMLCSDGLSDVVGEEVIEAALRDFTDPQAAADELVRLALEGGGPDNVTVVVGDVSEHKKLKRWPWVAAAIAVVLVVAAIVVGLYLRG
ncbi:PP2C family protein-serine/threonine phosphatase [Glycomyces arizonensis]|uniref:PP2C family protein-serine/threonine phosphatase n=1 Tax=Glycomyces arizonensis TaxID=256035 RepID=UPI0004094760|nr:protein phosphatase 2C domain-containing protein [Glycomyces arizonensis]